MRGKFGHKITLLYCYNIFQELTKNGFFKVFWIHDGSVLKYFMTAAYNQLDGLFPVYS